MENEIKILLVEDEETLGMILCDSLRTRSFEVDYYSDGKEGYQAALNNEYDILVLDVMLPNMDGFSIAKGFRKVNDSTPIIFLTAKSQTEDVVEGFTVGGNDYLKKPFSIEELIVRIKSLVGRTIKNVKEPINECFIGQYKFDTVKQTLEYKGEVRTLTHRESEILVMLYEKRNQVLERKLVLDKLWGDDSFFNARSMDVFITRLRKYLRDDSSIQIINIRGIGYKLIL